MMTSKNTPYTLCSLLFEVQSDYETNLTTLIELIEQQPKHSLIVAPEVCLSGYDYEHFDAMVAFSTKAVEVIKQHSFEKIIILTMVEKRSDGVYNVAKVFHNGEVVYERAKARLFRFGDEHKYMLEGSDDEFKIITVDGIKIAVFICFELRFKELWQMSEGADVIAVCAWWGKIRSENFRAITQTLAIINQCYVVASDAQNDECTALSGIITPMGEESRNEKAEALCVPYSTKEIEKMRRYMDVGIK